MTGEPTRTFTDPVTTPPTDQTAPAAPPGRPWPERFPVVPGYEILGEVGAGGMGVVYRARQVLADRLVALKMIRAGAGATDAERARFRNEARAVARLQHPNIVQVFEVGEHEGNPFFSLELCPGGSLKQLLAGHPLDPSTAARLVRDLARGVQHAHEAGIIHRDLKPANVLLAACGLAEAAPGTAKPQAAMTPKVADFGLARRGEADGLTRTGAIMGTPAYMSPEQARADQAAIGPATDVWALGAILYECLTGRPPFLAPSDLDTVMQVVNHEPVPPRRLVSRLPRDLETITLKCLQKEPGKRYGTASELADDLGRFLEGRPVKARRVGAAERALKWVRRNPVVAALLAVVMLLLGVVVVQLLLFAAALLLTVKSVPNRETSRANRPELMATGAGGSPAVFPSGAVVLRGHGAPVTALAFGKSWQLLTGDQDGKLILWDLETGQKTAYLDGLGWAVEQVDIRGGSAWALGKDGTVMTWNLVEGVGPAIEVEPPAELRDGVPVRPGRRQERKGKARLLFENPSPSEGTVRAYADGRIEGNTGAPLDRSFSLEVPGLTTACVSPALLATGNKDGAVQLWGLLRNPGTPVRSLAGFLGHKGPVAAMAFSADGTLLVSAGQGGTVQVWDGQTGAYRFTLTAHEAPVHAIAAHPRFPVFATANGRGALTLGRVLVWDGRTGCGLASYQGPGPIQAVGFDPEDAQRLALGCGDGTVRLWRPRSWLAPVEVQAATLAGLGGPGVLPLLTSVPFLPDQPQGTSRVLRRQPGAIQPGQDEED